jgi:exopolysaccharide biosynthesis polyprenyl glycosylphosphotransferase
MSLVPFGRYLVLTLWFAAFWIVIFWLSGLYTLERPRRVMQEMFRVVSGCTVGVMGLILLIFFQRVPFTSRFVILAAYALAIVLVITERLLIRVLQQALFKSGYLARRVVIIGGDEPSTNAIIGEISRRPELGYNLVKRFGSWNDAALSETETLHKTKPLDELFVTDPNIDRASMEALIEYAEDRQIDFRYAADTVAARAVLRTTTVADIPVVEVVRTQLEGWGRIYKRVFDLVGSLILIVLTSPIMLVTAAAVALESRGPIIFRNERVGQGGRVFHLLKFRSMLAQYCVGPQFGSQKAALAYEQQLISERDAIGAPVYKIKDDPRITRVGKFIRRFSIDELPQLFNVLWGAMSLVGPRPHQPREVAKYERHHRRVLTIKPGVTGMAQVAGRRDLDFEGEVRLDTFYIENWGPGLDLVILLKTPLAVLGRKGAY